ncbi:MAG: type II secretion system GspH family protein [Puniceicoccales bacterium]|jgi:prepilin-type N-terminal cleavage/methylation domain-containing protein|nr:type II secretion system GspH family protein [Puniceicoccales bacterium]
MRSVSFRRGFTLLEILVAMAILSVLVTILGKFFHRAVTKVVSDQESIEYQLQCGRLVRLLEDDLRFMPPAEVANSSANVYSWVKCSDDTGIEVPTRCVYALDAEGNVHRVLLWENQTFDLVLLSPENVVASGIGELSIVQTAAPDARIDIRITNHAKTRTQSITWFPAGQ